MASNTANGSKKKHIQRNSRSPSAPSVPAAAATSSNKSSITKQRESVQISIFGRADLPPVPPQCSTSCISSSAAPAAGSSSKKNSKARKKMKDCCTPASSQQLSHRQQWHCDVHIVLVTQLSGKNMLQVSPALYTASLLVVLCCLSCRSTNT
jgi:hypothetical protein